MSAIRTSTGDGGLHGLRMTADEYLALGETSDRYELIHGVVCMAPSARPRHNEVMAEIITQLKQFSGAARKIRVFPETDVHVDRDTVYCPDISIYRAERVSPNPTRLESPPDLVIELLSASTRGLDLVTKLADYQRASIAEYWAIDPADLIVRTWTKGESAWTTVPSSQDTVPSVAIAGFTLDLASIRRSLG